MLHQVEERHIVFLGLALEPARQFQHVLPARLRRLLIEQLEQVPLVLDGLQQIVQDRASRFCRRIALAIGRAAPARHCMRRMNSVKVRSGSIWRGASSFQAGLGHGGQQRQLAAGGVLASVCKVAWPMPRLGVVAARMKAGSSSSLASSRK